MRLSIHQYAANLALSAAQRSEDPWTKVGAVAFTEDNRLIAAAYNGLLPGIDMADLWRFLNISSENRDSRLPYMVHAEQNLCSLLKRGEASWVMLTHSPCSSCLLLLASHGIKRIYYLEKYHRDDVEQLAKFYAITLIRHYV